jgi:glycosyltransferase involved in cell wall biosynthesis
MGRFGPHDVVVDVQNAIPFFTPVFCGRPVVVLVHHVHREQWQMLFGARVARAGWWVESRLAPLVYRQAAYVAVSQATKSDLQGLGIDAERITVVNNGSPLARAPLAVPKTSDPSIVYLGRLVPHKRIELLIEAVGELRTEFPGLRARIVGQGAWEPHLVRAIQEQGLGHVVTLEGFVDEPTKRRMLAESWVLALPSVQEGWGLVVVEAAAESVPAVAFAVGGLSESIVDGVTGVLASDQSGFVSGLRELLASPATRARMGQAARARAATFTWEAATAAFDDVLSRAEGPGVSRAPDAVTVGSLLIVPEPGAV